MNVTMKDIAQELGISIGTVSKVLRDHPDIQEFYLGQSSGGTRRSYRTVKQYRRNRRWYG